MLFNSYDFILVFLPIVFVGYWTVNHFLSVKSGIIWLCLASLFFYGYWNVSYVPLIVFSFVFNFLVGRILVQIDEHKKFQRKLLLIFALLINIGLLGFYKYYDFFASNINHFSGTHITLLKLVLPLGISFFTFQQVAYIVDSYKKEASKYHFGEYLLFVTFFPQLIAGPIVHHGEMVQQFADQDRKRMNFDNIAAGLFIFSIGLAKKVLIADHFALWANQGFESTQALHFLDAWRTSLSYTLQLFFDFSGYTDMAIGAALLFNIHLPDNFDSPYISKNIQEFWQRWHITLSRFLRDYIYIPLGGNRKGEARTYLNLMLTFLIGGFWHGAGWLFIFWGFLHGAALVLHRAWKKTGRTLPTIVAWFFTFNFVNIAWVFFRATSWDAAFNVLKGMAGLQGTDLPILKLRRFAKYLNYFDIHINMHSFTVSEVKSFILWFGLAMFWILFFKNSSELRKSFKPSWKYLVLSVVICFLAIISMGKISEFIYFQF